MGGSKRTQRSAAQLRSRATRCLWCLDPNIEDWDDSLCRMHEAEYEGLSEAELDRRDAEQYAEEADAMGWQAAHNRWR